MFVFNFIALSFTLFITNTVAPSAMDGFEGVFKQYHLPNDEKMHFDAIKNQFYLRKSFAPNNDALFAVQIPEHYVERAPFAEYKIVNIRIPKEYVHSTQEQLFAEQMDIAFIGSDWEELWAETLHFYDSGEDLGLKIVRRKLPEKKGVEPIKLRDVAITGGILLVVGIIALIVTLIRSRKADGTQDETESVV